MSSSAIVVPQKATARSSRESESRTEPSPARASRSSAASGASIFSSSQMRRSLNGLSAMSGAAPSPGAGFANPFAQAPAFPSPAYHPPAPQFYAPPTPQYPAPQYAAPAPPYAAPVPQYAAPPVQHVAPPAPQYAAPQPQAAPAPHYAAPQPQVAPPAPQRVQPPPVEAVAPTPAPAQPAVAAAPAATAPAAPAAKEDVDVHSVMLDVVAESTGYPADMLGAEMALEGDLGIDSIKRVEILSSVQDRIPGLPEVDTSVMGNLQTLGEIVDYMNGLLGDSPVKPNGSNGEVRLPFDCGVALGRFELEAVPAPETGLTQPGLYSTDVYVTSDGSDLNERVAALLRDRHVRAHAVDEIPDGAQAIIELSGLRDVASVDEAMDVNRISFRSARALAQGEPVLFVTVQDTGGAFGLRPIPENRAYLAGLAALVRTARQEWPQASLKTIDLERGGRTVDDVAELLVRELVAGGPEVEVGLPSSGKRLTLRSVEVDVEVGASVIGADDIVVVSGGARGVTADCVVEWARRTKATFVLLGRTPLSEEPACCAGASTDAELKRALLDEARANGEPIAPAELGRRARRVLSVREIRNNLRRIESAGGHAVYESCSVTDAAGVADVLERVRAERGPISGLVHAAGVLADKRIEAKTDEDFDFVFNTKIDGLRAMLAATQNDDLKVISFFSSVSARCGNNGQSDYAMANEVLAKVALDESRRRPGVLVKSFGWGPWEGGMVTPALKAKFAELGVPMIPLDEGARMFADELTSAQPGSVDLVFGGSPTAEALLVKGADERALTMAVHVDDSSHPYLRDHSIAGTPVIPVVTVADWFARAARFAAPERHLDHLEDLRVLKGIRLDRYDAEGEEFEIRCTNDDSNSDRLLLELVGAGGTKHYRAIAVMSDDVPSSADRAPSFDGESWTRDPIYDGEVLFHGKAFQVIEGLDGATDAGVAGRLRGVVDLEWPDEPWALDVAALDGALQMAVLFTERALGRASLPTSIASVRAYQETPVGGQLHCTAVRRGVKGAFAETDVVISNEAGERLVELNGVRTHLLPKAKRA